jgi:thiamine biosynthesis protein ThiS
MDLTINGQLKRVDGAETVEALIRSLGLDSRKLAVERNRAIVPKSQYQATRLAPGDAIEIVHFVGGG